MATPVPGCTDCAKTQTGGRTHTPGADSGPERYEVRDKAGAVIGKPFRSVVAAATYMTGHPGSSLHDLSKPVILSS